MHKSRKLHLQYSTSTMKDSTTNSFKILMFPWLAHGHISPYLELAKRILKLKNFHIYFCTTPINFPSINTFITNNKLQKSIHLVEINLQSTPQLPPHYHTTKNLPSHLNFTLLNALQTANSAFSEIIAALSPDLVLYDVFQPWASKVAARNGNKMIPAVYFSIFGGGILSFRHHQYTHGDQAQFPFPAIKFEEFELRTLDYLFKFLYENVYDVDQDFLFGTFKQSCELVLVKSSKVFEGKYIDYLSSLSHKKIIPVGSLVDNQVAADDNKTNSDEIIQWLNKKSPNSTVYISFGSEYFLSKEEIGEIAKALELCGDVNFIWIIRFPVGMEVSLESVLPEYFLHRVKDRGMVFSGWAPQGKILSHPNTGGFLSHCGRSSVLESVYFGVPVIAMPMKLDQPIEARILADLGCGVEIRRRENEVHRAGDIAEGIRKVIVEESGEGMRRTAREFSKKMRMEEEEEMNQVAEELWQLCLKHKKC